MKITDPSRCFVCNNAVALTNLHNHFCAQCDGKHVLCNKCCGSDLLLDTKDFPTTYKSTDFTFKSCPTKEIVVAAVLEGKRD